MQRICSRTELEPKDLSMIFATVRPAPLSSLLRPFHSTNETWPGHLADEIPRNIKKRSWTHL